MRSIFSLALIISFCQLAQGQTYTTYSQGKNYVGGPYVAPVVTKTYGTESKCYLAPAKTSYNTYSYSSAITSPFAPKKSQGSTGDGGSHVPVPKGRAFKDNNGKYGIQDGYGKKLVEATYEDAGDFSQLDEGVGYYWVKEDGKYGVIDPYQDKILIPIKFDALKRLNSITALVTADGKMGVVEITLKEKMGTIIPIKYDDIGPFDAYCLWVKSGNKYGVISCLGTILIPVKYDEVYDFSLKGFLLKKDNKMGLINVRNEVVLPFEYDYITMPVNGLAWVLKDKKWGLINFKGEVLATPQYDAVYEQAGNQVWIDDKAVVSKAGKNIYINKEGKEIQ
jgi:WG containing repeat